MDGLPKELVRYQHEHGQILAELPTLTAEARLQILQRLCELEDADLLHGRGPTPQEQQILDEALAEFDRDGDRGTPWREAIARIAASGNK
jgi:hypothetical protein